MNTLLVFLGGGIGAAMRHGVNTLGMRALGPTFPWSTVVVNVMGSLAMGLLVGWFTRHGGTGGSRLFLVTGLLGGFTTFSAFALDAANLWERGFELALGYVLGSIVLSIAALFAGLALSRSFV